MRFGSGPAATVVCQTTSDRRVPPTPAGRSRGSPPAAFPLLRVTVREPSEYRRQGKSPLFSKAPARQIALLGSGSHRVLGQLQEGGNLFESEDLVDGPLARPDGLHSANRKLTIAGWQSIGEEFGDEVLLRAAGRLREAVERRHLLAGETNV
jgi:hypothetical protein